MTPQPAAAAPKAATEPTVDFVEETTVRTVRVPSSDPRVAAALWRSGIATTTANAMPQISVQPAAAIAAPIVPPPLPPMPTHEPIEIADAIEIEAYEAEDEQVIVLPCRP